MNDAPLQEIVSAHKRDRHAGMFSICSAHPSVLGAGMSQALERGQPLLIESTCSQVNPEGGYTGMTPPGFRDYVWRLAERSGFPRSRLVLGGDHLGPFPWKHEPVDRAMAKARLLVRECVLAGYTKIHLDTTMKCADDRRAGPLEREVIAARSADLCRVAEETWVASRTRSLAPCYVIGTEVPAPGGGQVQREGLSVTSTQDIEETIDLTRRAFLDRRLGSAWRRVIAVVAQPGVEFADNALFQYDRRAAAELSQLIEGYDQLIYEAHSTDFQTRDALKALVEDHFAILKVGPALTFAFREAVFALAAMEQEWLSVRSDVKLSAIRETLDSAMLDQPGHWQGYYSGSEADVAFARKYSFSDRSRYYWPAPRVQEALARLLDNLEKHPPPLTMLSQFLPIQYERVRAGALPNQPVACIHDKIRHVLADYACACGLS